MKINPYAVPALLTPAQVSQSIGLGVHVLQNWRNTDIGPPYTKLTTGPQGRVRYRLEDVLEWQKECWRVVPDGWEPIGEFPGESAPIETDRIEWLPPGRAAIAIGIPIPTLTAWFRRAVGLPFIWIGGRGQHKFMYDRRDVEVFISRRKADPSIVPVIEKKPRKDPRTREERYRMLAEVWKEKGHTEDEIRRRSCSLPRPR